MSALVSSESGVENMLLKCTELKQKGNDHFKAGELGASSSANVYAVGICWLRLRSDGWEGLISFGC